MGKRNANKIKMIERRYRPSSVFLKNNILWIAGGSGTKTSTKSSEFVNFNMGASSKGPDLPFEIWGHMTVKYR